MKKKGRPPKLKEPIIHKHLNFPQSLVGDMLKAAADTGEALGYDVSFNGMVVILCKRGLKGII
jgi:hypothetical protein